MATASSCDEGWELFDGKCYFFRSGELLTWSLAQQFCQEKGGDLPLPQDRVENTGIWNLYTKNINKGGFWLGIVALDENSPLKYTSRDGQELNYTNWNAGEPNSPNQCVFIGNPPSKWYDMTDCIHNKADTVCEKPAKDDVKDSCQFEEDTIFVENSIQKEHINECRDLCFKVKTCKVISCHKVPYLLYYKSRLAAF